MTRLMVLVDPGSHPARRSARPRGRARRPDAAGTAGPIRTEGGG